MDTVLIGVLVAAAAAYIGIRTWKVLQGKSLCGCGKPCSQSAACPSAKGSTDCCACGLRDLRPRDEARKDQ